MMNKQVAGVYGNNTLDDELVDTADDVVTCTMKEMNALQQVCSDKSLVKIAKDITNCDGLWPYLKISQARHEEIYRDKDSYSNYKLNLLLAWRKECGDQATYQNLRNAFEDWENKDIIDVVNELALNEYESDTSSTTSGYHSSSLDSFEDFEIDSDSSFTDLLDDIMDAIKVYYKNGVNRLKTKIIVMLNSNPHIVPHRKIKKLSKWNCNTTDKIFEYFSSYVKKESPEVLRIMVDASGCKKALNLYKDYFRLDS